MIKNASSPNFDVGPKKEAAISRNSFIIKWWAGKDSNLRTLT